MRKIKFESSKSLKQWFALDKEAPTWIHQVACVKGRSGATESSPNGPTSWHVQPLLFSSTFASVESDFGQSDFGQSNFGQRERYWSIVWFFLKTIVQVFFLCVLSCGRRSEGWGPERWGAQNFALFFFPVPPFRSFLPSLGGLRPLIAAQHDFQMWRCLRVLGVSAHTMYESAKVLKKKLLSHFGKEDSECLAHPIGQISCQWCRIATLTSVSVVGALTRHEPLPFMHAVLVCEREVRVAGLDAPPWHELTQEVLVVVDNESKPNQPRRGWQKKAAGVGNKFFLRSFGQLYLGKKVTTTIGPRAVAGVSAPMSWSGTWTGKARLGQFDSGPFELGQFDRLLGQKKSP